MPKTIVQRLAAMEQNLVSIWQQIGIGSPGGTPPSTPPEPVSGFTDFTPTANTRVAYVAADGSDPGTIYRNDEGPNPIPADPFNPGAVNAYATMAAARADLGNGDRWLLLRRGDTFTFGTFTVRSGASPSAPYLLGSYGTGARPIVRTGSSSAISSPNVNSPFTDLAVVGIDFYAHTRDPDNPSFAGPGSSGAGFTMNSVSRNLLIEDCRFRFYGNNLNFENAQPGQGTAGNFTVRRCQLLNAYDVGSHSQGIFTRELHGLLIEDCFFYHNGWNETVSGAGPTIYNHNLYIQFNSSNTTVRNCIIADASSHGTQLRSSGLLQNCLYVRNSIQVFVRAQGDTVEDCVLIEAKNLSPSLPRGQGIATAGYETTEPFGPIAIRNNIVANKIGTGGTDLPGIRSSGNNGSNPYLLTIEGNIVYNHGPDHINIFQNTGALASGDLVTIRNNTVQSTTTQFMMTATNPNVASSAFVTLAGNRYSPSMNYRNGAGTISFATWQSQTGDTSTEQSVSFVDPNRNLGTYHGSIGETATYEAFIAVASDMHRGNWDTRYLASAVNDYIRAGFVEV